MDNPELIEKYDAKLAQLLTQMHHDGMNLHAIIFLLDQKVGNLKMLETALTDFGSIASERLQSALETTVVID
jgi:hypothetical protein